MHNVDRRRMPTSMHDMPDSRNWFSPTPAHRQRSFAASSCHGINMVIQGQRLINFATNDYLGLSLHADIRQAAMETLRQGLGSGASRLISGDNPLFHELEQQLAAWKGYEACMLVGSGMLANIGLLPALAGRHDSIHADRLNHASLVDGARLSGSKVKRFPHRDMTVLERQLQQDVSPRKLIVSDGVFSMDGDQADITTLMSLAERFDALLVIDDAHGIGTLPDPRGLTALHDIAGHARLVEVGTFGKAFGGYGAFILGTTPLINGLRQHLRTMIYSTAMPPAMAHAMLAALTLIRQGELTTRLQRHIRLFRQACGALPLLPSETAIQPLILGSDERALKASRRLREAGLFVPAIRPPTVPEGTARLRITLSAAHQEQQILQLADALQQVTSA